jgi:hypothetical protein
MTLRSVRALFLAGALAITASAATVGMQADAAPASRPDFGPNVHIFNPSMDQAAIQAELNAIAVAQVHNEFGTRRDAVLFEPGTYGTVHPLVFQVGYYTSVAGLGLSPDDVHIKGLIEVPNQCNAAGCFALTNFWRSLSNLTIDVTTAGAPPLPATAPESPGCVSSNNIFAVSQAAPVRRVAVNGLFFLFDYCAGPGFASGGFIADSKLGTVVNATQQQWITRNSAIGGWTNAVWNQVFMGVAGAPAQAFPNPTYTTLAKSPVTVEPPYLYQDSRGAMRVFVPAVQRNTSGPSWTTAATPGSSLPISSFFVARPNDSPSKINQALRHGKNLILTPGIYKVDRPLEVTRANTIVLGLGFPTLVPTEGNAVMRTAGNGVSLNGLLIDAGLKKSDVLLQVGSEEGNNDETEGNPTALHDVFFRIGGATPGKAKTALVVNTDGTILDDIWAWRADHGNGVGWTSNTSDTGVMINADNVSAYGLFVEHFQKYEVVWNGNHGTDVFFQNEMPYDVPRQAAWREAPGIDGYAAFKVGKEVDAFSGYGMGSYSFFNQGVDIFAANAFEVPSDLAPGSLHDLLTIFLDPAHGKGGILNVINGTGGSSTIANPDKPVTVVSYP